MQVILLRELMVALGGDEAAIGIGLAAWLAGIAAGAALAGALAGAAPALWSAASISLLALAGPIQVIAMRLLRLAVAPPPGEILPLETALILAALALAPTGALVGAAFTSLAAAAGAGAPGSGIATLYIFESIGALTGGLAVSLVVVPYLPPVLGIALAAAACSALGIPASSGRARGMLLGAVLLLGLTALPAVSGPIERATVARRFAAVAPGIDLLDWADTPYQHIAVGGTPDATYVYSGGQYTGMISDEVASETLASTVGCLAPRTGRVLALGGVALGPLRFLLRFPVTAVDLVEPDRRAFEMLRRHLAPQDSAALGDPRVRIVHDDPRRFLAHSRDRYDLILALQPDPVTLLLSRLTTVEFFRAAEGRLGAQGVFVMTVGVAPASLTGETAALGGSIYGALREAFPVVHVGPGPEAILVAGGDASAATLDPEVLAARWSAAGVEARAFAPEMFAVLFPVARVQQQEAALERAAGLVPASRDQRPVSFLHALARRLMIAGGPAGNALSLAARAPRALPVLLVLLASLTLLVRRALRSGEAADPARARALLRGAAIHAVLVTGACGMVWSLLLLFSYQTSAGALYGRIGTLTAVFMTGLAAGATITRASASADPVRARAWLVATTGAALAFASLLAWIAPRLGTIASGSAWLPMALHGGLLLLAGSITGAIFPAAAGACLATGYGAARAAGAVESADHAGAAPAALLAAVLFFPMFGLGTTAWLLAALEAIALGVVALTPASRRGSAATLRA